MYYKVPLRFQREVMLHVLKNTQSNLLVDGTSTILGIFGPPGEGKTVMCRQVLEDMGVTIEKMSVSEFEHRDAGVPVERLRNLYYSARDKILSDKNAMAALIIDDADTAFGNWGEMTQYTVNTQILIGELMQLANDEKERKVPIIITGNDFSKIYAPLRRCGRMLSFYWNPTKEERIDSVKMIFPWLSLDECIYYVSCIEEFAKKIGGKRPSISFYATIKNKLFDDDLWEQVLEKRQKTMDESFISELSLEQNQRKISLDEIINKSKDELENIKNRTDKGTVLLS